MKLNLETPDALLISFAAAATLLLLKHFSELRRELETNRRNAYVDLLTALSSQLTVSNQESLVALNKARAKAFLLASDSVAKSMGAFFKAAEKVHSKEKKNENVSPSRMLNSYAKMVLFMRKDSGEKSKLSIEEIIDAMPISYSEIKK